jgi:ring-1,2-phenylacetyl-CoA epoxidase subunit PaaB
MESLDPRVIRLPAAGTPGVFATPVPLDQFGTYEVFVQPKEGKPFQHEGIVHAPDLEMAFILAKETFTRRFTCVSLCVTDTRNVHVSPTAEGDQIIWDILKGGKKSQETTSRDINISTFEIYFLPKRGKQHLHACTIESFSPHEAMLKSKEKFPLGKQVYNLWAIRTTDIFFTSPEEMDFWMTLSEKKFRDASDYKGGDKLKNFIEATQQITSTPAPHPEGGGEYTS